MVAHDRWAVLALLVNVAWVLLLRTFLWNPTSDPSGLWITVIMAIMIIFYLGAALLAGLRASIGFRVTMYLSIAFALIWSALSVFVTHWSYMVAFALQLPLFYTSYRAYDDVRRKKTSKLSPLDLPVFG